MTDKYMSMFKYFWFSLVMLLTRFLPDVKYTMIFRGLLLKPIFFSCGSNLQIAADVRIVGTQHMTIGNNVFFSGGVWILATCTVIIEDEVMLGPYVVIVTGDHSRYERSWRFGKAVRAPIKIGRGTWVGAHGVIGKGVTVGSGSCIAAGGIVTSDIPDDVIAGGVPASVIKTLI